MYLTQTWEVKSHVPESYTQALAALESLLDRINNEIQYYEKVAINTNDEGRRARAMTTRQWLEGEGGAIIDSLRRKIAAANHDTRQSMIKALNAAVRSADLAAERDMNNSENRDMLWEWADQILCSVAGVFRRFPEANSIGMDSARDKSEELNFDTPDWTGDETPYNIEPQSMRVIEFSGAA